MPLRLATNEHSDTGTAIETGRFKDRAGETGALQEPPAPPWRLRPTPWRPRENAIAQLKLTLDELKRSRLGRSSEKRQPQIDQLELALEDAETGEATAPSEPKYRPQGDGDGDQEAAKPRRGCQKLSANSPIAKEALDRISELYAIERKINGQTLADRQAERDARNRPLVAAIKDWLEAQLPKVLVRSDLAKAMRYGLSRWQAIALFLEDATVAIDNNVAERAIRPSSIGRKNRLFAGSDRGAENAATIMTLIETAKLNNLDPETYLPNLLDRLPDHKTNRLDELLPWSWKPAEHQS